MKYDYSKLNGRIVEVCGTQGAFANLMHLSERTISLKLTGKVEWKQSEMLEASKVLDFPTDEIRLYFFTLKVQSV